MSQDHFVTEETEGGVLKMNVTIEEQYLATMRDILANGTLKPAARAGMPGTLQTFGTTMRGYLKDGFPLYTTKEINFDHILHELNWMIKGHTNVKYLEFHKVRIWHDDSYNYYCMFAKNVIKRWNILAQQCDYTSKMLQLRDNFVLGYNKFNKFQLIFDLVNSPFFKNAPTTFEDMAEKGISEDNMFTKKEYRSLLKQWGDTTRSECLSPSELDKKVTEGVHINIKTESGHSESWGALKSRTVELLNSGSSAHIHIIKDLVSEVTNYEFEDYDFGDCGKQYGYLWRGITNNMGKFDQIYDLIKGLKDNPYGRRHIIDSWNVPTLKNMALNACHPFVQFNVDPEVDGGRKTLSCAFYMRSNDMFLGNPYNIAFYALLTQILAYGLDYEVGTLDWMCGDAHIYENHIDVVKEQVSRTPYPNMPRLDLSSNDRDKVLHDILTPVSNGIYVGLDNLIVQLHGYKPQEKIKAELSTGTV